MNEVHDSPPLTLGVVWCKAFRFWYTTAVVSFSFSSLYATAASVWCNGMRGFVCALFLYKKFAYL